MSDNDVERFPMGFPHHVLYYHGNISRVKGSWYLSAPAPCNRYLLTTLKVWLPRSWQTEVDDWDTYKPDSTYCSDMNSKLTFNSFNSSPPCAAYMSQWTGSSLVQVMACCLFGTKPLPKPMLAYCQLDSWEHISVKFELEFYHFHSRKCNWKCRLPNWRPFCPGGDVLKSVNIIIHWNGMAVTVTALLLMYLHDHASFSATSYGRVVNVATLTFKLMLLAKILIISFNSLWPG